MRRFYVPFRYFLHSIGIMRLPNPVDLMVRHLENGQAPAYKDIAPVVRFFSANPDFEPVRKRFLAACGWSTPCHEAVELIACHSRKIVEVGAGNGAWAMLLKNAGVDIKPTDIAKEAKAWGRDFDKDAYRQWAPCEDLAAERAFRKYQHHHDVLISWPPRGTTYPFTIASHMKSGRLLFFIGTDRYSVMANSAFFAQLETDFEKLDELVLPHWHGTADTLTVWRKR